MKSDTPRLNIFVLGPPRIEIDGHTKSISRRQVRAMLYYLASQPGDVTREQLSFLFWPDTPEEEARRKLSILLSHLRRTVHPIPVVVTRSDSISLDSKMIGSDLIDFNERISHGGEDDIGPLKQAVSLYRGAFLAGFSLPDSPEYESWLTLQRRHLEQTYLRAMMTITTTLKDRGEFGSAVQFAQAYLDVDELSEQIHRLLIELYVALDDRHQAQQQFERCAKILERDLGVRPLPQTRMALASSPGAEQPPRMSEDDADETTTIPGDRLPLLGRDEEMRILCREFAGVRAGKGKFILATGEAGIGKSFLMQAFLRDHASASSVFSSECYPSEPQPPYQPILEALHPALEQLDSMGKGLPDWVLQLGPFYPELQRRFPAQTDLREKMLETAPGSWFEAFLQAFLALRSGTQPIILHLEDLQWADSASLAFLVFLARRLKDAPMLILGTCRSEEAELLRSMRHSHARLGSFLELQLQGFDFQATEMFFQVASGKAKSDPLTVKRLQEITGGNPFFLLELLRSQAIDRLHDPDFDWATARLPETILQALDIRLKRLDPHTYQVLETCAVLGKDLEFDLIRRIAGRSAMETIESLDELQRTQILWEQNGLYRFSHGVMRAFVYQSMSTWRRRLLHKRAGLEFEVDRASDLFLLAWHFERADPSLSNKAANYLIQAADKARSYYAYQEAINCYQRALELLTTSEEYARTARTWMKLGLVHQTTGDYHNAQHAYAEGFDLWQRPLSHAEKDRTPDALHMLRMEWREPTTLDPALARDTTSAAVIDQLYRGLLELNPDLGLVPCIAERFELDPNGCRYIFKLRGDVHWSDGVPVTARDFVYAWKRVLDPKQGSPNASRLYDVKGARAFAEGDGSCSDDVGIRAIDDYTLVVELEAPCSYFPYLLNHHVTYPVPSHVLEGQGAEAMDMEKPLSCGPFQIEAWIEGQSILLNRNPDYHGRYDGNVEQVLLTLDPDWHANLNAYENDHLDVLSLARTATEDLVKARKRHSPDYISAPAFLTTYLGFNLRKTPFNDPQVRKAFAYAIDRHEIASQVMQGFVFPATGGFIPPGMPGHTESSGTIADIERARDLLHTAGYPEGRNFPPVELIAFQGSETRVDYLSRRLAHALGVQIRCKTLEFGVLLQKLDALEADLFFIGWLADYPDSITFLRDCPFHTWAGWSNEEYSTLISNASISMDADSRIRLYKKAEEVLSKEAPIIPLNYARHNLLVKPWVTRFPPPVMGTWFFKDVVIAPH